MIENTYKGKTRAEWISARSENFDLDKRVRRFLQVSPAQIEEALLWFDDQDKKSRHDTEERRFQTQLDETRRHGLWTRSFAGLAVVLSAASVVVSVLALNKPPQKIVIQTPGPSQAPVASSPQTTNSEPSTQAQKKP